MFWTHCKYMYLFPWCVLSPKNGTAKLFFLFEYQYVRLMTPKLSAVAHCPFVAWLILCVNPISFTRFLQHINDLDIFCFFFDGPKLQGG